MAWRIPHGVRLGLALGLGTAALALAHDETVIYGLSSGTPSASAPSAVVKVSTTPAAKKIVPVAKEEKNAATSLQKLVTGKPDATKAAAPSLPAKSSIAVEENGFPWKRKIVTTYFWIGQGSTSYSPTTNYSSAWDRRWKSNFGGTDDPQQRIGFTPRRFAATLNPFYVALPFNDVKYPRLARKHVPWWSESAHRQEPYQSQCRGRWVEIRTLDGKTCFGQWEDVGPLRYDHASYVFGSERPRVYSKAGLDVSPSIHDYLGLDGLDLTDWRFVEPHQVPAGPWLKYGEQAIVFSALKRLERPGQPKLFPVP